MIETVAIIVLFAWVIQLVLAYRQARIFYKRISSLRKLGRCATGLAGGRYRGRVYVALVVHPLTRKVIVAEQLQGITVFARLRPIPQLEGLSLDELVDPTAPAIAGLSQKVQEAVRSAAETISQSFNKVPSTT